MRMKSFSHSGFNSPVSARAIIRFDVTPAHLITAIITERGIIKNVTAQTIATVLREQS